MTSIIQYKTFSILFISILIAGCSNNKNSMIDNIGIKGATISTGSLKDLKNRVIKSDKKIKVAFINNPAELTGNDKVILYFNDDLVFYGDFDGNFTAFIPKDLKKGKIVHFNLKIAQINSDNTKVTYYSFQNKSICYWNNEFKYLYIGFFPNNDETNKVNFFPQQQNLIQ